MIKKDGRPSPTKLHTFDQHWPFIQSVVKRLIDRGPITQTEWHDLFYQVHMVCSWDDRGCYKLLRGLEAELLNSLITGIKTRLLAIEDGQLQLKEYVTHWNTFCDHCTWFPIAFQQLDLATKSLLSQTSNILPDPTSNSKQSTQKKKLNESTVRYLMLKLWYNQIIAPLNKKLINNAIQVLFHDRNDSVVDHLYIVRLCESFKTVNWLYDYTKVLESKYVQEVEIFYHSRADETLRQKGIIGYIKWASEKIDAEKQRAKLYLGTDSPAVQKVDEACTKVLVTRFVEPAIMESSHFIRINDAENLKIIFNFIDRIQDEKVNSILKEFEVHLVATGLSYMMSFTILHSNCEIFTEKLIEIYRQFSIIIKRGFGDDPRAKVILERAFSTVVNDGSSTGNTAPQLLAGYSDLLLRRSNISRKCKEDELYSHLSEVLFVIRFLKNKEAFVKYYKLHLARRLILNVSFSGEKEERFVTKLKDIAGMPIECIYKMIRMFKDLKLSEEFQQQYRKSLEPTTFNLEGTNNNNNNNNNNNSIQILESQPNETVDFQISNSDSNRKVCMTDQDSINIRVLNPVAWTTLNDDITMSLPSEITSVLPSIRSFYMSQYSGRRLDWYHQLSTATMTFTTPGGRFELEVSASQLCVLMAFNDQPNGTKTLGELEKLTELNLLELKKTIWTLASNQKLKVQLMLCEPELDLYADLDKETNKYSVNREFVLL